MFRWMLCRGAAVRDGDGTVTRLAGSLTDITDAKVADALTGLPNRLQFVDLLDRAIARTQRRQDELFAHPDPRPRSLQGREQQPGPADGRLPAGRRRRPAAGGALRADPDVPQRAGVTLARLGGDEFTILLEEIADASDAVRLAEQPPIGAAGAVRHRGPSGVRVRPPSESPSARPGMSARRTRCRMPRSRCIARRPRRDAVRAVRSGDARARGVAAAGWKRTCATPSIARNSRCVYQPIISLASGRISRLRGAGALATPERGLISPVEFIPVAEDTGMIRPARTDHPGRIVPADGRLAGAAGRQGARHHVRQRLEPAACAASISPTRSKR